MSMQCVQYVLLFLVLAVNSKFTELHALTQATCSYAFDTVIHIPPHDPSSPPATPCSLPTHTSSLPHHVLFPPPHPTMFLLTHMAVDGLVGGISSRKNKNYDSSVQQDGSRDDQIVQVGTRHTHNPEGVKWPSFCNIIGSKHFQ